MFRFSSAHYLSDRDLASESRVQETVCGIVGVCNAN